MLREEKADKMIGNVISWEKDKKTSALLNKNRSIYDVDYV